MGVDLYLHETPCKTCGHQEEYDSYSCTYNLSPMWKAIFPNDDRLIQIDGMTGKQAKKKLLGALIYMNMHHKELLEFEPANGWGSYNSLYDLLENLIDECDKHPKLIWKASR